MAVLCNKITHVTTERKKSFLTLTPDLQFHKCRNFQLQFPVNKTLSLILGKVIESLMKRLWDIREAEAEELVFLAFGVFGAMVSLLLEGKNQDRLTN